MKLGVKRTEVAELSLEGIQRSRLVGAFITFHYNFHDMSENSPTFVSNVNPRSRKYLRVLYYRFPLILPSFRIVRASAFFILVRSFFIETSRTSYHYPHTLSLYCRLEANNALTQSRGCNDEFKPDKNARSFAIFNAMFISTIIVITPSLKISSSCRHVLAAYSSMVKKYARYLEERKGYRYKASVKVH